MPVLYEKTSAKQERKRKPDTNTTANISDNSQHLVSPKPQVIWPTSVNANPKENETESNSKNKPNGLRAPNSLSDGFEEPALSNTRLGFGIATPLIPEQFNSSSQAQAKWSTSASVNLQETETETESESKSKSNNTSNEVRVLGILSGEGFTLSNTGSVFNITDEREKHTPLTPEQSNPQRSIGLEHHDKNNSTSLETKVGLKPNPLICLPRITVSPPASTNSSLTVNAPEVKHESDTTHIQNRPNAFNIVSSGSFQADPIQTVPCTEYLLSTTYCGTTKPENISVEPWINTFTRRELTKAVSLDTPTDIVSLSSVERPYPSAATLPNSIDLVHDLFCANSIDNESVIADHSITNKHPTSGKLRNFEDLVSKPTTTDAYVETTHAKKTKRKTKVSELPKELCLGEHRLDSPKENSERRKCSNKCWLLYLFLGVSQSLYFYHIVSSGCR